jgi:DNA-binding transcriptional ArsR family regulator
LTKKAPKRLIAPELTTALSHPTRNLALAILNQRVASPKEIAKELDCSIRHVTYHLGVLEDLGCVELFKTEPVMGGRVVEHFYRATQRSWFDRDAWAQVDEKDKPGIDSLIVEAMSCDISEAMLAGTFSDPSDNHVSRTPMTVDNEGWEEVATLLASTLEGLIDIQGRVSNRSAPETEVKPIKVEILHFRSPDRSKQDKRD